MSTLRMISFVCLVSVSACLAGDVTLEWSHDDADGCTYLLKTGTESGTYPDVVAVDGLQHTLTDIPLNEYRYSIVTAVHPIGGESDPSDELRWAATAKPNPPTGLRKIWQQIMAWLHGGRGLRRIG